MKNENTSAKITPSDLYAELTSIERAIFNLRDKIERLDGKSSVVSIKEFDSGNHVEVLCKRLKEAREARGYNLNHASRKLGMRSETIQGLEEGKGTLRNFVKYGKSLGLFFCFLPVNIKN